MDIDPTEDFKELLKAFQKLEGNIQDLLTHNPLASENPNLPKYVYLIDPSPSILSSLHRSLRRLKKRLSKTQDILFKLLAEHTYQAIEQEILQALEEDRSQRET